jgi:hypothetical protein
MHLINDDTVADAIDPGVHATNTRTVLTRPDCARCVARGEESRVAVFYSRTVFGAAEPLCASDESAYGVGQPLHIAVAAHADHDVPVDSASKAVR